MKRDSILCELRRKAKIKGAVLRTRYCVFGSKLSSVWYGGEIAEIDCKNGYKITVDAVGDVDAALYTPTGRLRSYVKDRNNTGGFSRTIGKLLKTDKSVQKAIENGQLVFNSNNWYELFGKTPRGLFVDLGWVVVEDDWAAAIEEAIDNLETLKEKIAI